MINKACLIVCLFFFLLQCFAVETTRYICLHESVSLLGVSLKPLLKNTNFSKLYARIEEAYKLLQEAVVGVLILVFCRKHEEGKTRSRSHKFRDGKLWNRVVGFDASALYLSTMSELMPCWKGVVEQYPDNFRLGKFEKLVKNGSWFGFAEVDIEVPRNL